MDQQAQDENTQNDPLIELNNINKDIAIKN